MIRRGGTTVGRGIQGSYSQFDPDLEWRNWGGSTGRVRVLNNFQYFLLRRVAS